MAASRSNAIKDSKTDVFFSLAVGAVLTLSAVACLYPLMYVLFASVSDPVAVNSGKMVLWPIGLHAKGYRTVFENQWILIGYRNTVFYTVIGTLLNVAVTFMASYALSRKDMYGHSLITFFMVFTMWFGGGLIPTFLVVNRLGLVNSPAVMVILGLVSVYNCIICRSFIQNSIPYELQEAAYIDGANDFQIAWRIIFPLSGPVLAILSLYYALSHWNSYFNALIYLDDRRLQTLQLFLREVLIENSRVEISAYGDMEAMVERTKMAQIMKYALIVVASVPMLVIYPFVQKFFVKGVMIGSVKG